MVRTLTMPGTNISSDSCEVVTSAHVKSNQDLEEPSLPPMNPTTADVQKSLEEKMKQERREFEMALNQKLKMAPSGLFTHSIFFQFAFCKKIIDLPGGQINDPSLGGKHYSLPFLPATPSSPSLTLDSPPTLHPELQRTRTLSGVSR